MTFRMEILSFEKDEGGALRQTTLINEPLSKIGAAYQGRCRIYILFMVSQVTVVVYLI